METTVSLVNSPYNGVQLNENLAKAISLTGFKLPSSVNNIVLKLNLCYYWNASTGQTTDPKLVEAVIDYLREKYGSNVEIKLAEADASAMRTKYAFRLLGYEELSERKNVQLLNLSEDEIDEREITVNGHKMNLQFPKSLLRSDLFINIPKLKVMRATHISCAMKNLFGAMAFRRKVKYHPLLAESIVGINKYLKPHLNIVDGLVALGRFSVRLDLLMAGTDAFSVDWVAAQVMGYNPSKIKFLNLAIKEQLGNPKDVKAVGEAIETFRKNFPTENTYMARAKMRLQLSLIKFYQRISGDIIPPSIISE